MTDSKDSQYNAARVFHDQAEEYDAWFDDSLVYAIELATLTSLHTAITSPALEVGVGPGRFAEKLGVTYGIDPARAPLRLASGRGVQCCQAFGEQLPIQDGVIGAVYLLFTLCFVADPLKTLLECSRVLKDDGVLVIGMIPAASPWGMNLVAKREAGHPIYRYASFYTIESVKNWLARANLGIVEYRSTLYQVPGAVEQQEFPRIVLDEQAGFVVIVAGKNHG
jgi:ubiquinone/menaquinone biosynthesis C-methylase UbiE